MTDAEKREKVIRGLEQCIHCMEPKECEGCPYEGERTYAAPCGHVLMADALALLKEQEEDYPICEKCGRQIKNIHTSVFNYDGTDSIYPLPISFDREHGCVLFETSKNWTGYGLTDEEVKEDIRCPYCGEYPFDESAEVDWVEPVRVLMWTSSSPSPEQMRDTPWEGDSDAE